MIRVITALLVATSTMTGDGPRSVRIAAAPAATIQSSQKVIKDVKEYNAYILAFNEQDPVKKAASMEAFVQEYPQSVVLLDAAEHAMTAYQQAGNTPKFMAAAQRVLAIDPGNVRALANLASLKREARTLEAAREGQVYADRGLAGLPEWRIPDGTSKADFQKLRTQMFLIFYGAAGWGHFQAKEFGAARDNYLKALEIDPLDFQNTSQAGYVLLMMDPIDRRGFWYLVKAAKLAQAAGNPAEAKQALDYATVKYRIYHGSSNGWDAFVASVAAQNAPPAQLAEFRERAHPTPCDLAARAMKDNKPEDLSFGDYQFILQQRDCSSANKAAADIVWNFIRDKQRSREEKIKLAGVKVIAVTQDGLDGALDEANQSANIADIHIRFTSPISDLPAVGSIVEIVGVFTDYRPDPFLFRMDGDITSSHE
ncbi:MAG TPA: hypothetical protein VJ723_09405 [Candidatus Angelobacter sp.]|nr:hypothetical protein [Candidatus Angelobacter sp.]